MCSGNALNGLSTFLHGYLTYSVTEQVACQYPKRAIIISTVDDYQKLAGYLHRVNALNGLPSFLQYPSATPVKLRVSDLHSVCNCQNILTISLFTLFFFFSKNVLKSIHILSFDILLPYHVTYFSSSPFFTLR